MASDMAEFYSEKTLLLLRAFAHQDGVSLTDISKRSGLAKSTISETINGKSKPSLYTVQALVKAFGLSLSEFYSIIEQMGDQLNDVSADLIAFTFTAEPPMQKQMLKVIDYLKANPGTSVEELLRLFPYPTKA